MFETILGSCCSRRGRVLNLAVSLLCTLQKQFPLFFLFLCALFLTLDRYAEKDLDLLGVSSLNLPLHFFPHGLLCTIFTHLNIKDNGSSYVVGVGGVSETPSQQLSFVRHRFYTFISLFLEIRKNFQIFSNFVLFL